MSSLEKRMSHAATELAEMFRTANDNELMTLCSITAYTVDESPETLFDKMAHMNDFEIHSTCVDIQEYISTVKVTQ